MNVEQPLKIPFNLYLSAHSHLSLVAHTAQVPTCTQRCSIPGILGLDVNLALAGCQELRLYKIITHPKKSYKLTCLLCFLGNTDTRDGHGEEGITSFQHFTGGLRPQGSFVLDLQHNTSAQCFLLLATY